MDAFLFDRLSRLLSTGRSRRQTLRALALAALGLPASRHDAAAGPGCKDVGARCKQARQCCSGVCRGKKGKKRCKAHDTGGCQAGQTSAFCLGVNVYCTTGSGEPGGRCNTTTGNAGYCSASGDCTPCTKDADCRTAFGPRAACLLCPGCAGGVGCFGPNYLS